jgi:hypothetical protein
MSKRSLSLSVAVLALVALAAVPLPASAQLAAAYTNPLDSASDISGWSNYDYYNYWNVDSSPIVGHDGNASLNCNDGTGLDYLGYNYMEIVSAPINLNGLQDPVLTWWCLVDLPDPSQNYFDGYLYLYDGNYNQYFGMSMGLGGWQELQCSSSWHQHTVAIPGNIQGSLIFRPYIYFEDYYYQGGNQGWFVDDIRSSCPTHASRRHQRPRRVERDADRDRDRLERPARRRRFRRDRLLRSPLLDHRHHGHEFQLPPRRSARAHARRRGNASFGARDGPDPEHDVLLRHPDDGHRGQCQRDLELLPSLKTLAPPPPPPPPATESRSNPSPEGTSCRARRERPPPRWD